VNSFTLRCCWLGYCDISPAVSEVSLMIAALALVLYRLTGEKVDITALGWIVVIFCSLGLLMPLVAIICGF
jgi:hypothetical protein